MLLGQWEDRFGYRPLLAESFTDPEAYVGTCYKASNWEPVGMSEGYSRHRADFYVANERPKRLWLRELQAKGRALLRAPALPAACRPGLVAAPAGVLPVNQPQLLSLSELFARARSAGQEHPLSHRRGLERGRHGHPGRTPRHQRDRPLRHHAAQPQRR